MRCHAPNCEGFQCEFEIAKEHKFHCSVHVHKAHKLYEEYKKICKLSDVYNVEDATTMQNIHEKLSFLKRCYFINSRAYHARLKHRKYAFVPKLVDKGHSYQFTKLMIRIERCEELLRSIYDKICSTSSVIVAHQKDEVESSQQCEQNLINNEITDVYQKVQTFKAQRVQEDKETQRLLAQYANENVPLVLQKQEIISNLVKKLQTFSNVTLYTQHEIFIVLHIIMMLKRWKFFGFEQKLTNASTASRVIHKCIVPDPKFCDVYSWMQIHMTQEQMQSVLELIEMYCAKIVEIIGDWHQSCNSNEIPVLEVGIGIKQITLCNMPKQFLRERYYSLSKYKLNVHPDVLAQRMKQIGQICKVREVKKLLLPAIRDVQQ